MIAGTLPVSFIIVDPEPSTAKHPLDKLLRIFHLISKALKDPPAMQETPVQFLGQEDPWRRERLPTPVFWPGEFHGLYSPWGHKESDMTEQLSLLKQFIKIILGR